MTHFFSCKGNLHASEETILLREEFSAIPSQNPVPRGDLPICAISYATEAPGSLTYGLASGPVNRIVKNAQVCPGDEIDRSVSPGEMGELVVRDPYHLGYWAGPGLVEEAPKAATSAMGLLTRCFRSCFGLLAGTSH